jgi:3-hydroxybutyryl-CoA dehydrogenase
MPLLEIVRSEFTSDEAVAAVYKVAKAARKSPIVVQKEALGFIANRLQVALLREALYIVEQGIATAQEVDIAVKQSFGRRLSTAGPIEMIEVQDGWDLVLQVVNYMQPDLDTSKEPSPLIHKMLEQGKLGAKSGQGFYEWPEASLEAWRKNLMRVLAGFLRADRETQRSGDDE